MEKYDLHLQFLVQAFPMLEEQVCHSVFLDTAKRDIRKALFFLFQPQEELEQLLSKFSALKSNQVEEQQAILQKILHCYCPNDSYTQVVAQVERGIPIQIDSETLPKLKNFRRAPRKEILQQIFRLMATSPKEIVVQLLEGLRPFGRELEPLWARVDAYANYKEKEIAVAALNLLAQMPLGVQKSIATFAKYCRDLEMCFHALSAMQTVTSLAPSLLIGIFNPIITEYRRLTISQGKMNDLWEEFRLIQQIARNNGFVLSIPDISLGRF